MKTYKQFIKEVKAVNAMPTFTEDQLRGHYEGQCEMLRIFKHVINWLDQHKLSYFAEGGTLLGSVREKGFIVHDSDIDIMLIDDEYDYFYHNFPKQGDGFFFLNTKNDPMCCSNRLYPNSDVGHIARVISTNYIYSPHQHPNGAIIKGHAGLRVDVNKMFTKSKYPSLVCPGYPFAEFKTWKEKGFTLRKDQLFPLKKSPFEDIEINIANCDDLWLNTSWGSDYMSPFRGGYPHEYPNHGKITKLDLNNLPSMYEENYKYLYT